MRMCKEINLNDYDYFEDFAEEILNVDDYYHDVALKDDHEFPCYLMQLTGTQLVKEELIPFVLEAACHFSAPDQLVAFSVTSAEDNHHKWLEAIEMYPGAQVVKHQRTLTRTVYLCLVPVTPVL